MILRFISLQHDLFEITVDIAVGYTIDLALTHEPKFNVCYCIQLTIEFFLK